MSEYVAKKQEQVLKLLEENKTLTTQQIARVLGLSRTRCSEYLAELERRALIESFRVGRKKLFRLSDGIRLG